MIQNTLQQNKPIQKLIQKGGQEINSTSISFYENIWFWIAIVQILIIFFLIVKIRKKSYLDPSLADISENKLKKSKKAHVDMDGLMLSINGSKDLYKELSRLCHPDRFINSEKQELAQDIFQEISRNRRDFQKLVALKERAVNELNIKLK